MTTSGFVDKVFTFTQDETLFSAPCRVIVGVSGGADSTALLHALCDWPQPGLDVTVVHVHHGLRGESADRDASFVEQMCRRLGVPLQIVHTDVAAVAASLGCGMEEAGRRERYRIFEEQRVNSKADYILTAHNADDQTETVLMHLLRGCGTDGLCGIPASRGVVRRPLLCCTRQEIEAFCEENSLSFVTDETNTDTVFTRNRIRHEVLPLLRQVNPGVDVALRRLSAHSREDSHFLYELALDALHQSRLPEGGYRVELFVKQPIPIRRRMIHTVLEELAVPSIEEKHILSIETALFRGKGGVILPTELQLSVSQGRLLPVLPSEVSPEIGAVTALPFSFRWKNRDICLQLFTEQQKVHKKFLQSTIDYDRIQGGLYIRCRREGDTLHPAGRGIGKTLKKLMNEWQIPAIHRDSLPLLCDEAGVVLVPGYACDERVRVSDDTKHFLVWCTCTEQG